MRATAVVVLLLVAACRGAPEPSNVGADGAVARAGGTPVSAPAAGPVAVRVAVAPDTVGATGELRVTVTATNTTDAPRTLEFSSGCATDYELLDEADAVVTTADQMCTQALTEETLAAGQSLTRTHVLARGAAGMPAVPAGRYRVRGVLLTLGAPVRSAPVPVTFR